MGLQEAHQGALLWPCHSSLCWQNAPQAKPSVHICWLQSPPPPSINTGEEKLPLALSTLPGGKDCSLQIRLIKSTRQVQFKK